MARLKAGKDRAIAGPWNTLKASVNVENLMIKMRDGHKVQLRVYTPIGESHLRAVSYSYIITQVLSRVWLTDMITEPMEEASYPATAIQRTLSIASYPLCVIYSFSPSIIA